MYQKCDKCNSTGHLLDLVESPLCQSKTQHVTNFIHSGFDIQWTSSLVFLSVNLQHFFVPVYFYTLLWYVCFFTKLLTTAVMCINENKVLQTWLHRARYKGIMSTCIRQTRSYRVKYHEHIFATRLYITGFKHKFAPLNLEKFSR